METQSTPNENTEKRLRQAIRDTAPGTALRQALDMIIAGQLGALICIGDEEAVLASGNDGFPLDVSFTANRLFELSKMDGAIVVDGGLSKILRANFHLNPDATLPTTETGMRHRTAARMSQVTRALVISVSERRQVVHLFVDGRSHLLKNPSEIMSSVNQLLVTLQSTRQELDRALWRLTSLELENLATLADVTSVVYLFEVLMSASEELRGHVRELGSEGITVGMRREELVGDMDDAYTMLIRDYAADSSVESAMEIRRQFRGLANAKLRSAAQVGAILGYPDLTQDSIMVPLGLRTLQRTSVVRSTVAERLVDEYDSLLEVVDAIQDDPTFVGKIGVNNPSILADRLSRMRGPLTHEGE